MKTALIIITLSISITGYTQVTKFKATKFAFVKFNNQKVNNDWDSTDVLITMDVISNERIKIYSKVEQVFDIIQMLEPKENSEGKLQGMICVDQDSRKCELDFLYYHDGYSLSIEYSDEEYIYIIHKIE